jgi:hypothetical protein
MEQWRELYKAAVLETDFKKLQERVQKAMDAIQHHSASHEEQLSTKERIEMEDALFALRVLQCEREDSSPESSESSSA